MNVRVGDRITGVTEAGTEMWGVIRKIIPNPLSPEDPRIEIKIARPAHLQKFRIYTQSSLSILVRYWRFD